MDYSVLQRSDGTSRLYCFTCGTQTEDRDDAYLRHCPKCQFLGPQIRQRWNGGEGRALLLAICEKNGRYKKIQCPEHKTWHAVPTEEIATQGIRGNEIHKFPLWTEAHQKTVPTDLPFSQVEVVSTDGVTKLIITSRS